MARIALESAHLMRLAQLLSQLRETASGEVADRAARAEQWLAQEIQKQQEPPEPDADEMIRGLVNSLREEWSQLPTFSAAESWQFGNIKENLAKLKPEDWEVMREFLSYSPRQGERIFQVQNREWFLKAPQNTLTAAKQWGRTHRQPKFTPMREPERFTPEQDTEVNAMIHEVLGHLISPKQEKPPKPNPIEPPKLRCDSSGQTSFID